uniref:F-box domain-containing protein n=1 Tax=Chenopodium quinoa TaxID=63459 RepID=A0A803MUW4_CHEQI
MSKFRHENKVVSRIDELDDDILSLIFSRIASWKLLVQCRSVSKRWNNIISQPIFLDLISSKFLPFTVYINSIWETSVISEHPFFQSQNPPLNLKFSPFRKVNSYLVGSYSDLLIYCNHCPDSCQEKALYCFYNLITRENIEIEIPIDYIVMDGWNWIAIGCAGHLEGISSVKGEGGFKFVRIVSKSSYNILQVFSFESGNWSTHRKTLNSDLQLNYFRNSNSVTLNNKLHWLLDHSILVIDPYSDDISRYILIKLPSCLPTKCTLGVCKERLRLMEFAYDSDLSSSFATLNVWELDDYSKSTWTVVCTKVITTTKSHPDLWPLKKSLGKIFKVMFHRYDCDVVYLATANKVVQYNLKSGTFKVVVDEWGSMYPLVNPLVVA